MQANLVSKYSLFFFFPVTVWLGILPFQDHINLHNPYFLDRVRAAVRMRNSTAPVFLTSLDNGQCCAVSAVFKPDAYPLSYNPAVNVDRELDRTSCKRGPS